uniref:Uncharacterized protein n=1 Tax=Acanthochromis polyacanthus TaxID=80966 RepID=A0A3Q1EZZ5_9TELE
LSPVSSCLLSRPLFHEYILNILVALSPSLSYFLAFCFSLSLSICLSVCLLYTHVPNLSFSHTHSLESVLSFSLSRDCHGVTQSFNQRTSTKHVRLTQGWLH